MGELTSSSLSLVAYGDYSGCMQEVPRLETASFLLIRRLFSLLQLGEQLGVGWVDDNIDVAADAVAVSCSIDVGFVTAVDCVVAVVVDAAAVEQAQQINSLEYCYLCWQDSDYSSTVSCRESLSSLTSLKVAVSFDNIHSSPDHQLN